MLFVSAVQSSGQQAEAAMNSSWGMAFEPVDTTATNSGSVSNSASEVRGRGRRDKQSAVWFSDPARYSTE